MSHAGDPRFNRLVQLLRSLQQAEAVGVRIEHSKDGSETSLITFTSNQDAQAKAESAEVRSLLGLKPDLQRITVHYGGYSGRNDEISLVTRSMLQVMLELAASLQVPQSDISERKVNPGLVEGQARALQTTPAVNILSGKTAPIDTSVAVQYAGRWFWIADTDIRSKDMFGTVMLLFSISDIGFKGNGPIVTVPANG
jgi:hypothetical protein